MERGTIVLVRFPFTDYSSEKLRPAVIISADNKKDVCVAFISSVVPSESENADFLLTKEDEEFALTGLKKDSVFRMNKIATVDKGIILGKLGKVSDGLQEILDEKLKIALGLD